jgi:phosphoribosyl 1,2-cyclic phosphate phosphodiesterase
LLLQRWSGPAGSPEDATTVLIDTSPDLREQLLAAGISRVDAVVYSHDHADQTHGIDDLRNLAYLMRARVRVHMDAPTARTLTGRFAYAFSGAAGYPAILGVGETLEAGRPIALDGPGGVLELTPLAQNHGAVGSLGFRSGAFGYSNDVVDMPEETFRGLTGLSVWIVDALRYAPHPSHANLETALAWRDRLKPKRTILTNLHVDMDYRRLCEELPPGVEPAYDGLQVEVPA